MGERLAGRTRYSLLCWLHATVSRLEGRPRGYQSQEMENCSQTSRDPVRHPLEDVRWVRAKQITLRQCAVPRGLAADLNVAQKTHAVRASIKLHGGNENRSPASAQPIANQHEATRPTRGANRLSALSVVVCTREGCTHLLAHICSDFPLADHPRHRMSWAGRRAV